MPNASEITRNEEAAEVAQEAAAPAAAPAPKKKPKPVGVEVQTRKVAVGETLEDMPDKYQTRVPWK